MPPASRVSNSALRLASPVSGSSSAAACRALTPPQDQLDVRGGHRHAVRMAVGAADLPSGPDRDQRRDAGAGVGHGHHPVVPTPQGVGHLGQVRLQERSVEVEDGLLRRSGLGPGASGVLLGPGQLSGEAGGDELVADSGLVPGDGDAAVVDLPGEDVEHRPQCRGAASASEQLGHGLLGGELVVDGPAVHGEEVVLPVGDPGRGDVVGVEGAVVVLQAKGGGAAGSGALRPTAHVEQGSLEVIVVHEVRDAAADEVPGGPAEALLDPGAHEPDGEVLADRHHEVEGVLHQRGVQDGSLGIDRRGAGRRLVEGHRGEGAARMRQRVSDRTGAVASRAWAVRPRFRGTILPRPGSMAADGRRRHRPRRPTRRRRPGPGRTGARARSPTAAPRATRPRPRGRRAPRR